MNVQRGTKTFAAVGLSAALVFVCGGGSGDGTSASASASEFAALSAAAPMLCADVSTASLAIPNLVITTASSEAAFTSTDPSKSYPAHCKVTGKVIPRIAR